MGTSEPDPGELERQFGIPGRLDFEASALGGTIAALRTGAGAATVALYGGQVLHWQPAGHEPVLWLSPVARLGTGKPVRGGVPVCWPWFGPAPGHVQTPLPQHGFARVSAWRVLETSVGEAQTRLRLGLQVAADEIAGWPHAAAVTLEVVLGETLDLLLTTRNTGSVAFELTEALHTYFKVGDIGDVTVERLDGHAFHDAVALGPARERSTSLRSQSGPVRIDREIDRIYVEQRGDVSIVDRRLGRRIEIEQHGSASTVVWNPGVEKAALLADVGGEEWRRFVCVETANTVYDQVSLEPGSAHTLAASYRVVGL